jgi:putative FmdB family regulatory protein
MPIYEFKCKTCGYEFEELRTSAEKSNISLCGNCGGRAEKRISKFSPVVSGGSTNEPVDMSIGREANKRWQNYYDKQSARRNNKKLENFDLPKSNDGKYMPIMGLGDKNDKKRRNEFSTALQEHREDRKKRGIPQFSDSKV